MNEEIRHALIDTEDQLGLVITKLNAVALLMNVKGNPYEGVGQILDDLVEQLVQLPVNNINPAYSIETS